MAKGFKHGAGGGTFLNFKVAGGTSAPSNPKENTIWVNTGNEITAWAFSADEPNMTKNLVKETVINTSSSEYSNVLYIDAELLPNTTYTLSFEGAAGNQYYTNENVADFELVTATSGRVSVTFTTKSTLNKSDGTQSSAGRWIILKNYKAQTNAHIFNNVQIEKGSSHDGTYVPYGGIEGSVWFSTGTSNAASFNALKKNGIEVCPISTKQYVNGAWISKDARIYKDGGWKAFQYVVVPNINLNWVSSSTSVNKTSESTSLTHAVQASSDGVRTIASGYVEIDTTGYDTLYAKCNHSSNNTTGSDQGWLLTLESTSGSKVSTIVERAVPRNTNNVSQTFEKAIDISALSGIYRIRSYAETWSSSMTYHYVAITDCRLY